MRNVRAILVGSFALVVLEVLLTSPQTGRIGELFALPASWARRLIDPTIPAIPDRSTAAPDPAAPAPGTSSPAAPPPAAPPTISA